MASRLFSLYQRKRWINININAIAAAAVSTLMVMGLIWVLEHPLNADFSPLGYTLFALVADIILDVACFLALHWVANHWRPFAGRNEKEERELSAERPNHIWDMVRVQTERMAIGPLYYIIASGLTWAFQHMDLHPSWAVGAGYGAALVVTRAIHTVWGLRSGSYVDHHRRPGNGPPRDNGTTGGPSQRDPDRPADAA